MIMTGLERKEGLDWGARIWLMPPSLEFSLRQMLPKYLLDNFSTILEDLVLEATLGDYLVLEVSKHLNCVVNHFQTEQQ